MNYKKEELRLKNDLFRPKLRAKSTKASDAEISDQPSKDLINADHYEWNAPNPSERLNFLFQIYHIHPLSSIRNI